MEREGENGEQALGDYTSSDQGFSPNDKVSSSVGSTEGAGFDGDNAKLSELDRNSAVNMHVVSEQDSGSPVGLQILADGLPFSLVIDGGAENGSGDRSLEENFSITTQHSSVDQESSAFPVDFVDVKGQVDDESPFHDAGREETFVDAPDELSIMSDGRSIDNGESTFYVEPQEGSEENLDIQVVEDEKQVRQLAYELALLQASLEKSNGDKEIMSQKYKEEREMLGRELGHLHRQLETMTNQQSFLSNDNGNGIINHPRGEEKEYGEGETHDSDTSLQLMIANCSKSTAVLQRALEEQLQTEGAIRELHAVIFTKDEEIQNLSAKISELSVSHDIIERYRHREVVMEKMLASLASVVQQEDSPDDSSVDRIFLLERSTSLMIENYTHFLSEINKLKHCLNEVVTKAKISDNAEFGSVFDMVCRELLDHKQMEIDFIKKLKHVENENKNLLEQLGKAKERVDVTDGESRKLKMELEQEKIKSTSTKEKLGMAVTKGKALVQQRDSLKQSLNEKTNELEKLVLELQEKSNALESAEMCSKECQSLAASLQESLSMRAMTLEKIQDVLSGVDMPDGSLLMDISESVRWLADQKNELLGVSLEYNKLKSLLSSLNLPEVVASYELESQISWLGESLSVAEDNIDKLQGEIISSKVELVSLEAELGEALNEIEHLKTSLSAEKRGNDSLQMGLEDLLSKYEAIVEKEFQLTSEKDRMARMFREACGVEDQGEFQDPYSNMATFIEICVGKIKEKITATLSESSNAGTEQFERIQSLLYLRNQEVVLCRDILEEEMLKISEMATITDELERVSKEIITLKDDKDSLQKDLERSDEKSALLREKLSMAVKKGKGLVQEREGLKKSIDEKNSEIAKLKIELQQQESELSGCRDQINGLSSDLERLPQLESDLVAMKDQKDQLEKYLVESNGMLERVGESIESIAFPVDTVFTDPVEKIKWLAACFGEYQLGKITADQDLEKVKEEVNSLSGKLVEASATIGSLEDVLLEAEKNYSLLAEEKKEMQIGKNNLEEELENAKVEVGSEGSKFLEACANIKLLEDALSRGQKNIAVLEEEKASACLDKNSAERELEKVKEETDYQARKLAEAYTTIKSLEEGFIEMEKRVSVLTEENNVAQAAMLSLERELEKAKAEANSEASKLADVHATVKSLEDALSAAGENITQLTSGKENAEMEVQALNAKLSACMAELAGTHGSLESQSVELFSHLNHLKVIMNDDSLLSSFTQGFMNKIEGLRDINFHLENIRNQLVEQSSEELQTNSGTEKDLYAAKGFSAYIDKFPNGSVDNIESNAIDFNDILPYITYIVEGFIKKNKLLEDKFEGFSSSMDELIVILLRALQETRDSVVGFLEPMKSLKLYVKALGAHKQAVESAMLTLKNDIAMLLSTWPDAAHDLEFQLDDSLVGQISNLEPEHSNDDSHLVTREASEGVMELHWEKHDVEAAEKLGRELRSQIKKLENLMKLLLASAGELRNKLYEAQSASQKAMEERDLHQNRISALENDLEALQEFCNEMKIKLKDHEAKEDMLKERDEELSLLHRALAKKEQETEGYFLSEGQVKTLFEKIEQIEIPSGESDLDSSEFHISGAARKLFSVIDNFTGMQHQMRLLSHAKEELQSSIALQVDEIEHLKKEAESLLSINQDLGKTESDLNELTINLERLIEKFGGNDLIKDNKFSVKGLLTALENLIMASVRECETSKSKAQDSNVKLHENQKVVDELSEKVKLLEGSIESRPALPGVVQERSILKEPLLPTGSEISEIDDVVPLGKNSASPVPYAAHVRTMRKGSSDHLALTIDSESDRLINHHEIDDDKGHAFKSLNTSGFIPIRGKLMADRIDGIWVSGGRVLMSRPRVRIGLIAYCLLLHLWLLGGIIL